MNKIIYKCSKCGTEMIKTIGSIYGSSTISLKCPECNYSTWVNDTKIECRVCNGEMDKFKEYGDHGHTILKCSKCGNRWVSDTPSYTSGSGWGGKKGGGRSR